MIENIKFTPKIRNEFSRSFKVASITEKTTKKCLRYYAKIKRRSKDHMWSEIKRDLKQAQSSEPTTQDLDFIH